jgi:ABC-type transport system involved in cytochrome bd biosynthesis fused ATPase/permease subunit
MPNAAVNLKQMKVIHVVFVVAVFLYALTAEQIMGRANAASRNALTATLLDGMTFVAGLDGLLAYYFRRSKLEPALDKLRRNQNDPDALKQWRFATILSLVLALSIGLVGFALRFLGAGRRVSWSFFLVALFLMLLWRPKLELASDTPGAPAGQ